MMVKHRSSNGFTLIEILIVIGAIAVFGALTAGMLANATDIYSDSLKRQKFISQARSSFLKIARAVSYTHLTLPTNREV